MELLVNTYLKKLMANKHELPKNMSRDPNTNWIILSHRVYDMRKGKPKSKSMGSYPTVQLALQAQVIATELTGTTMASRKKVRESKVEEVINNFRTTNGLQPIKTNA